MAPGGSHRVKKMDPREQSKIYNGASDAWSRAVELTVTPLIFGFVGYRLDLWAGTLPIFTIVLSAFCFGYVVWKAWSDYEATMQVLEAQLLASRRRPSSKPASKPAKDRADGAPVGKELVGP